MNGAGDVQPWGDLRATLGECALWCDRDRALYLTDIEARTLHVLHADGRADIHALPDRLGSFALCQAPGLLLLGLARSLVLYDTHSRQLGRPVPLPLGPAQRVNDGRCDPQGRFVFGTYADAADPAAPGPFWRVGARLQHAALPLPPARVANGLAFSPDGQRITWTDSPSRCLMTADYHADGRLGAPRVLATLPDDIAGMPDGATFDRDGGLWVALFGGGALLRLSGDGRVTDRVALPVSRPTCPVFAGPGFSRLAVTSAHIGLDQSCEPLAGAVLTVDTTRRGMPAHRFAADRLA